MSCENIGFFPVKHHGPQFLIFLLYREFGGVPAQGGRSDSEAPESLVFAQQKCAAIL
jgi:hypothetical protein